MIKKTITFIDYNGIERTENFYFNLTEAELTEMELSTVGGYQQYVQNVIDAKDGPSLIRLFKDLIMRTYGVKSPDGREFRKSEEISRSFAQTEAYSKLFMELATDSKAAADFVNGVVSDDMRRRMTEQNKLTTIPNN